MSDPRPSARRDLIALLPVLAVALAVRLWGFRWGLPGAAGEMTPLERAWGFWNWGTGHGPNFNPHDFGWPSFIFYLAFLLQVLFYLWGRLTGSLAGTADFRVLYETDPSPLILWGRAASTLADLGAVALVYFLGRRLFGRAAGAAAALVVAFDIHHVAWSQNTGPEVWVALFVLLASRALLDIAEGGRRRDYVFFGIWTGLGAATKYTPALLFASLPFAHRLARPARSSHGPLAALASAALAFFIASPFVLLDLRESLFYTASQFHRLAGVSHFGQEALGPGWLFYLRNSLPESLGTVLLLVGGIGLAASLARGGRALVAGAAPGEGAAAESAAGGGRRRAREALVFIFPFLYFLVMGAGSSKYDHYMLPITPFLALAAAGWIWRARDALAAPAPGRAADLAALTPGRRRLARAAPWVLLLATLLPPARGVARRCHELRLPDTRLLARAWIERHLPPGALVLSEFGGPELLTTDRLAAIRDERRYREIAPRLLAALATRPAYAVVYLPLFAQEPTESAPFYEMALYPDFEYCLLSSEVTDRYRRQPDRFAAQLRFYRWLDLVATPVATFSPGQAPEDAAAPAGAGAPSAAGPPAPAGAGPIIRIFSLAGARARYEAAGGPTLRPAWEEVRRYAAARAERAGDFAVRLGRAYECRGLLPEAALAWTMAAEFTPRDPELRQALAGVLSRLGHAAEARSQYEQVLAIDPRHVGALNNLGAMELNAGRPEVAERLFQRAIALDPNFADAHANLGWLLLYERADRAGARREFEAALRLAPHHPQSDRIREALAHL